jgi:hypothetical protein
MAWPLAEFPQDLQQEALRNYTQSRITPNSRIETDFGRRTPRWAGCHTCVACLVRDKRLCYSRPWGQYSLDDDVMHVILLKSAQLRMKSRGQAAYHAQTL